MNKLANEALQRIAQETDVNALKRIATNARGMPMDVERAAFLRLASISAKQAPGTVENACWTMVHAVEELRRLDGRKVCRMNYMRRKIETDGEIAALRYCALKKTDGFAEVIAYGTPELTAEVIVLRYSAHFDDAVQTAARKRLEGAGLDVSRLVTTS